MSRSALDKSFIADLADDYSKHGKKALRDLREENPRAYLMLAARLLPKPKPEAEGEPPFLQFLDAARQGKFKMLHPEVMSVLQRLAEHQAGKHPRSALDRIIADAKRLLRAEKTKLE